MFWYKDKTQPKVSFKAENEFENTFAPSAAHGGTITTKRNNAFSCG